MLILGPSGRSREPTLVFWDATGGGKVHWAILVLHAMSMVIYRAIWFWKDAPLYLVVGGKSQGAESTGTLLRFLGRYSAAQNDVTRGQRLSSGYSLDSINRGVFSLFVAEVWGILSGKQLLLPRDTPLQIALRQSHCHSIVLRRTLGHIVGEAVHCYPPPPPKTRPPGRPVTYVVPHQARSKSPGDIRCAAPGTLQVAR